MKKVWLLIILSLLPLVAFGQQRSARILLIPLDDRPPCLQFPTLLGRVGDTEVVTPPREMLGRFTTPGRTNEISAWLKTQNLGSYDAAILSLDMLAYGGLVASRVHQVNADIALKRLDIITWLHDKAPRLPLYGSSVIMRLAPTGDGKNEAYREKLARWAELAPDPAQKDLTEKLEKEIPAAALEDYRKARVRNLEVNLKAVQLTQQGVLAYTIFSQDDAHPKGVHVADRERLMAETARLSLGGKIAIQPGADEVSMLLLSRALSHRFDYHPRIHPIYSSKIVRNKIFPFEDRELNQTVSFHISAAGGIETVDPAEADILFFVFGSRKEAGAAESFADLIAQAVNTRRRVIVADIDPVGDIQGADPGFMEALRRLEVLPQLSGFAAWNTAGNVIGTALPHGIVHNIALQRFPRQVRRFGAGQLNFLLNRLLDDYLYHSLVRPEAIQWARKQNWNTLRLSEENSKSVEKYCRIKMLPHLDLLLAELSRQPWNFYLSGRRVWQVDLSKRELSNFSFKLPWGRTFEAEIKIDLKPKARAK